MNKRTKLYRDIPDHPDPVAPQKFTEVDAIEDGGIVLYDDVENGEWIEADDWVCAREAE